MPTARVASQGDVVLIAELWVAANVARQAELGLPVGPVAGGGLAEAERQVRRRLGDPASFAQLVEDDGELVAMALILQALDRDGASVDPLPGLAHVSMVAVRPDRWGQGLGAQVLALAQGGARPRGFTRAQLWTHETNRRAQRLYEGLGWEASGRIKIDEYGEQIRHYVREL
jgi:ribosomal protein S18 acetylase RimI-like enzyme